MLNHQISMQDRVSVAVTELLRGGLSWILVGEVAIGWCCCAVVQRPRSETAINAEQGRFVLAILQEACGRSARANSNQCFVARHDKKGAA